MPSGSDKPRADALLSHPFTFQSTESAQSASSTRNTTAMVVDASVQRGRDMSEREIASNGSPPANVENQLNTYPVDIISTTQYGMDARPLQRVHAMQTPLKQFDTSGEVCTGATGNTIEQSGGVSFAKTPPSSVRRGHSPQVSATKFLWCTPKTQIQKRISDDEMSNIAAAQQLVFATPSAPSMDACPSKPKTQLLQHKSLSAAIQDGNTAVSIPMGPTPVKQQQCSETTTDHTPGCMLSPTNTPWDRRTRFSLVNSKQSPRRNCSNDTLNLAAPPPLTPSLPARGLVSQHSKTDCTSSSFATPPLSDSTPRCESPSHFRSLMTQLGDNSPVCNALRVDSTKVTPQNHRFASQGLSRNSSCSLSNATSQLRIQQLRALNSHDHNTALRRPSQTISSLQSSALSTTSGAVDGLAKYSPTDTSDGSEEMRSSTSQRNIQFFPDAFLSSQSTAHHTLDPTRLPFSGQQHETLTDSASALTPPLTVQLTSSPNDSRSTARPCSFSDARLAEGVSVCSQSELGWSRPYPVLSTVTVSQPNPSSPRTANAEQPSAIVRKTTQPATLRSNLLNASRLTTLSDAQSSTTPSPNSSSRPVLSLFNSKRVPRARVDGHDLSITTNNTTINNASSSTTDGGDRSGTGTSLSSQPRQLHELSRSDSYSAIDDVKDSVLFSSKRPKDAAAASLTSPVFSSLEPQNNTTTKRTSQGNSPNLSPPLAWCYNVSTGCLSTYGSADERCGGRESGSAKQLSPPFVPSPMMAPQARTVANAMRERWEENHILMAGRLQCSERMLEVERERVRQLRRALQTTQQQLQSLKRSNDETSKVTVWDKLDAAIGSVCAQSEEFGHRMMAAVSARVNRKLHFTGKAKKTMQRLLTWFSVVTLLIGLLLKRGITMRTSWKRIQ